MEDGSHHIMSGGTLVRAVLEPPVSQDDMRAEHALSVIVVAGQFREIQEGQYLLLMFEKTAREPLPMSVGIGGRGKEEESLFELTNPARECECGQRLPPLLQPVSVVQNALELFAGSLEVGGRILSPAMTNFSQQMHQAFLLPAIHFVVGRIKVAYQDAREWIAQQFLGNFGAPASVDLVIGQLLIHERPEPMIRPVDLPARLVHVHMHALSDRLQNRLRFHLQPFPHPLQRLRHRSFRYLQPAEHIEQLHDLVPGQAMVILQHRHLHQRQGTQVSAGHFSRSIRSFHGLPASPAPISVSLKPRHFHSARYDVFLDMFRYSYALAQMPLAVWATIQGLFHFPVNVLRLGPSATRVPGFAAPLGWRFASLLGFVFGLESRGRRFLSKTLQLFHELFNSLSELQNLIHQRSLVFLQKQGFVQFGKILLRL